MTDSPTSNTPLTADDVKLLRKGDWLLCINQHTRAHTLGRAYVFDRCTHSAPGEGNDVVIQGDRLSTWSGIFSFLGRPDQSGWIPHDGGPNPARGLKVESKALAGELRRPMRSENVQWTSTTAWRPHAPDAPAGERLQSREVMLADLEAPKGEVEAAVEHIADRLAKYAGYVTVNVEQEHVTTLLSALTAPRGLEPLADDPAVAALLDSQYRAGALAGWNAACHPEPGAGEQIMARIRSIEPGSLTPILERNRQRKEGRP